MAARIVPTSVVAATRSSSVRRHRSLRAGAFALGVALTAQAAGAQRGLEVLPGVGQEQIYEQGEAWVVSDAPVQIALSASARDRKRGWLELTAVNQSTKPVTITERNVRISAGGQPVRVYTSKDVLQAEQSRQNWQRFAVAMLAGANAAYAHNSGDYSGNGQFQVQGRDAFGRFSASGSAQVSGTDPVARQMAISEANRTSTLLASSVAAQQAARMESLDVALFKAETLQPGEFIGGRVQFDLPRKARGSQELEVVIALESGEHRFRMLVDG